MRIVRRVNKSTGVDMTAIECFDGTRLLWWVDELPNPDGGKRFQFGTGKLNRNDIGLFSRVAMFTRECGRGPNKLELEELQQDGSNDCKPAQETCEIPSTIPIPATAGESRTS